MIANDTKLEGVTDGPDGCTAIQRDLSPLFSTVEATLGVLCPVWVSPVQKTWTHWTSVEPWWWWRGWKKKWIRHIYKERLRELGLLTLRKEKAWGETINLYKYLKKEYNEDGWHFPMLSSDRTRGNWSTGDSVWTSGNVFLFWGWLSTGKSCPERLWHLLPSRSSKAIWAWSWPTFSRSPCSSRTRVGLDDIQRSHPTSAILLFYDGGCLNLAQFGKYGPLGWVKF